MTATQINSNSSTPALRTLAEFGIVDASTVSTASYYVDAVIRPNISYREYSTVFFDDRESQRRVVLKLMLQTKKKGTKKVPVPNATPHFVVSTLKGYDAVKNMWGGTSHDEKQIELTLEEAAAFHLQFEQIRAGMVKEPHHWTWYPRNLSLAS
jgi:hypothetical protein